VVAPHPDDETLGCGGAIALLVASGCSVNILVVSDGTQSHPNSRKYPAPVLHQLRATETQCAMAILGVTNDDITFFNLPDGAVASEGTNDFSATVDCCAYYLTIVNPQTIFVPLETDPHPDHRATWQIVQAALAQVAFKSGSLAQPPRIIEYPIWDWDLSQRNLSNSIVRQAWRLDISAVVMLKQQAIAAYRSQTTNLIDDDPTGFRLTPQMLANFNRSWETYLELGVM
jgi:LmbE family N-acetylglucosaminyl deacetylase